MTWVAEPYNENMCEVTKLQLVCYGSRRLSVVQYVNDTENRVFEMILNIINEDDDLDCTAYVYLTMTGFSIESNTVHINSGNSPEEVQENRFEN